MLSVRLVTVIELGACCNLEKQKPLIPYLPETQRHENTYLVGNFHRHKTKDGNFVRANDRIILKMYLKLVGTAVSQWLSCCATNRKIAGSIPGGVIGIFHRHNPSDRTMALGSTQPLTEMSTRSISWG